jgi:hypothetical protein
MTVNHLLLTDVEKEEQDDDLLASLTNIAYATPQPVVEPVEEVNPKRKSRFFFNPTQSFSTEINQSKRAVAKRDTSALTILDAEVEARKSTYSKELPKALKSNIEAVREFFLKDIGPLALAAQAGTVQASQVMQLTLNTEIDGQAFLQFERMVSKASTIKMARFIAKYLNLPQRTVEELLQIVQPPAPKEVLLMNANPFDERRPKQKVERVEPQKE